MPSWKDGSEAATLHHMLCKKVAQLTKVIYHLNTKNEDQEARLTDLQGRYETEIGSIEADAAAKLKELQSELETARTTERDQLKARAEQLASSYEKQKLEAIEQWGAERAALKKSAESELALATRQLEQLTSQTASRLEQLEAGLTDSHAAKQKAERELEEAVSLTPRMHACQAESTELG